MLNTGQYLGLKLDDTSGQHDCSGGKPLLAESKETPAAILHRLADLFDEKSKEYGNSYKRHGAVMAALFPEGISLDGAEEFGRYAIFELMVVKMVRYSSKFGAKHVDSLSDISVYAAMLKELDNG